MGNRLPATSTFFRLCVSLGLTYAWDRVNTSIHVYKNRIFKHVFSNTHFNSNNVSHIKAINWRAYNMQTTFSHLSIIPLFINRPLATWTGAIFSGHQTYQSWLTIIGWTVNKGLCTSINGAWPQAPGHWVNISGQWSYKMCNMQLLSIWISRSGIGSLSRCYWYFLDSCSHFGSLVFGYLECFFVWKYPLLYGRIPH